MLRSIPSLSNASVLIIGDLMLDKYLFGDTTRISPEAPVPIVHITQENERPGGAGNVALNVATLGAKVAIIGVTGNDAAANTLCQQFDAANVTHELIKLDSIKTIKKLRIISRHQQLMRLDFEDKMLRTDNTLMLAAFKKSLAHADVVILSDYGKGTLDCAPQLIQLAKAQQKLILVDPKGSDFSRYQGADIITPNLKEFELIMGVARNEEEISQKAQLFLQTHAIGALLLTRGEHGMTLFLPDQASYHLPAHARDVFDVTGAGDTVIAVLASCLAAKIELNHAVFLANLAASLVVTKLGAASVSVPELNAALNLNGSQAKGIVNEEQLLSAITQARTQGKKIVFTNGCFDILHVGHVAYLNQARQLGDFLIVAVNDDATITKTKGPGRPVNTLEQRMAVLDSLANIDYVIAFYDDTPKRLLALLKPDILVKGGDYTFNEVVGHEIVLGYGGEVKVLGLVKDVSTTAIIDKMVAKNLSGKHIGNNNNE